MQEVYPLRQVYLSRFVQTPLRDLPYLGDVDPWRKREQQRRHTGEFCRMGDLGRDRLSDRLLPLLRYPGGLTSHHHHCDTAGGYPALPSSGAIAAREAGLKNLQVKVVKKAGAA